MTTWAPFLKACLNGNRTRDEHERVPLTPEELAADARAAVAAGARGVHVHARRADGDETLAASENDATVTAIRRACRGIPVGLTTGAWIEPDVETRLAAIAGWRVLPDFASVNFSEEGATEVARLLIERGIGVEAGLATIGDALVLADSGLGHNCLRILVEVEDEEPEAAVAAAAGIADELRSLGLDAPQLHHGFGGATWAVLRRALERGHDIRIGLEDTFVSANGGRARDNADLVSAAVALIEELRGRAARSSL
jgi:uncharacterized protein (DUF849 family)